MAEKRDIIRLRKRLALRFGVDEPVRMAFTEDISPEGLFIKTTNICPPGTKIKIVLTLSSDHILHLEGLVMWAKKVPPQMIHIAKKCGMGIRITRFVNGADVYQKMCNELMSR